MKTFFVGLNLKSRFPKPAVGRFVRSSEHGGYYIWRRETTDSLERLAELVNEASEFLQKNGNPHFLLQVLPFGEAEPEPIDEEALYKQGVELAATEQELPEDAHEKVIEGYNAEITRMEEAEEQRLAEIEAEKARLEAERKEAAEKAQAEAELKEKQQAEEAAKAGDTVVENQVLNPAVDVSQIISTGSETIVAEPSTTAAPESSTTEAPQTTTEQSGTPGVTNVPEAKKGKLKTKAEKAADKAAAAAAKEANENNAN